MKNFINVVFATDNNYAQHTAVAMASVLWNTKHPEKVRFFVIDDEIKEESKEKISTTVEKLKGNVEFLKIKNSSLEQCFVSGGISRTAYFRIDIANILDKSIEKVIYLDCDLLVYDDIVELWSFDMHGKPIAAVCDFGIMASGRIRKQKHDCIGLRFDEPYFNSGVLLMDLKQWRKNAYAKDIIDIVTHNQLPNHDQDALNKYFSNNWQALPLRWNVIPPVFNMFLKIVVKPELRKLAIEAKRNPAIFHYAGGYKPWEYEIYEGFNEKYYEYLTMTEFKDASMPQFDKRRKHRSITRQMWRLRLGNFWTKIFG